MEKTEGVIRWIVDWKAQGDTPGKTPIASIRYRALLPAEALRARGRQVELHTLQDLRAGHEPDWAGTGVVVLGKLFVDANLAQFSADSRRLLRCGEQARAAGAVVVADINDDHFARPTVGDHWRALAALADVCVVGSPAMGAIVQRHATGPVIPIGDPLASPKGVPRVYADRAGALSRLLRGEPLKLAWYGMHSNLPPLENWVNWIGRTWTGQPLLLRAVTRPNAQLAALCEQTNQHWGKRLRMEFVEWSEEAQWQVVQESDVVLVPSDPASPDKAVKTANRLTDALHAGRYVIASPVPSYMRYESFVDLGNNPVAGLHAYLRDPDAARERIAQGQAAVEADWNTAAVAAQWLNAFSQPRRAQPAASAPDPAAPVRLNLGCGDKVLDGWVNVDVAASRLGRKPDVIADLRDLSVFPDAHADEVMAIHVIEHFWRWEVEAVLAEWVRVLKPGGELVLECPNLAAACEEFLRDPDAFSGPGPEGRQTMWVFYGDPAWKDPLMVHRWGYTPASLSRLMTAAGLVDVRQEPAQYKMREPRDMRIVGRKP